MFHQISSISKNKLNQIIFCSIIFIGSIFNGSNSSKLIIINFFSLFFFLIFILLKKNNYKFIIYRFKNNKNLIIIFSLFILFLLIQVIPIPNNILRIISLNSFNFYTNVNLANFNIISLNNGFTFIELINYLNIFLIVILTDLIFFKKKHITRYLFYLSLIGFFHAFAAVLLFLLGNPEFFLEQVVYYKNSASGFFINRTNFSFFLVLTFLITIQYIVICRTKSYFNNSSFNLFYTRIFLIFITIGIICSFSRLGNFYLLLIVLLYSIHAIKFQKKIINNLTIFLFVLILFDILIMGLFFGGDKLLARFNIFDEIIIKDPKESLSNFTLSGDASLPLSRANLIFLGLSFFKDYIFFGYGAGAFETVFLFSYNSLDNYYANHVHADFIELIGELGIIGFFLICLLFYGISKKIFVSFKSNENKFNILSIAIILIFLINGFFDFSLNIPSNQYLFASLVTFSIKKFF